MLRNTVVWLYAVFIIALATDNVRESKVVKIAQGPVRGYKDQDSGVYFFQGIPYASIPTGLNRFKAPLPPPTWMHTLEAVRISACPQSLTPMEQVAPNMQEDCLIASVYVPDIQEKNLPVVVYVHGGAFQVGRGDMFPPSLLVASSNIIAVTFNYRVGYHGFLCLGTEDIPGNAGMKDQVAALRWVKKNIAAFGGNPDDVTIAGYSAGSAAVDLLMLSKTTKGLFNKVIPESGGSIGQWTIQSDPLENAKQAAKYLNFTNVDDIYALEEFYKTVSFELLASVPYFTNTDSTFGPSPCVERPTGQEIFLDKSPVDILKSGDYRKVPLLYGFANMEGLFRIELFDSWKLQMNEKFSDFLPKDLIFESNELKQKVATQVKKFYFGEKSVDEDVVSYVDYFTDILFAWPMLRSVKYHIETGHNQIYLYEYNFVDDNTPYLPNTKTKGAHHGAQSLAVFERYSASDPFGVGNPTKEFLRISSSIRQIWGNFIKTGKPIPEGSELPAWPPVREGWTPHMSLGNEISLRGALLESRVRFWDDIYEQYYRDPVPPPSPPSRRSAPHTEL